MSGCTSWKTVRSFVRGIPVRVSIMCTDSDRTGACPCMGYADYTPMWLTTMQPSVC